MKVTAINGSPREKGNTYHALQIIGNELEKEDINFEIINLGSKSIRGCIGCGGCIRNRDEKCTLPDDGVNEIIQKMKISDGIILGSPVYYSGISGTMKSFLDRVFYVAGVNGSIFRHKVAASIAAVRRSGGIPTFEQLNKYLLYSEMIIPASNYWNVIHGSNPGEVLEDKEGVQIMEVLARNMAWVLKLIENGKGQIPEPEKGRKIFTNFVR